MNNKQQLLRELPSIDRLLQSAAAEALIADIGRQLATEALRRCIADLRTGILSGRETAVPQPELLLQHAAGWAADYLAPTLYPVINATGVIVHTNLGRAPLSTAALAAVEDAGRDYSNLEYDIAAGSRGSRSVHAEGLLTRLTGGAAATVVNNNAAAVLLMLTALCQGQEVIISRSQLVEIGGGFRIPDVMAQSGARLVEVGTTNRTHLRDYAQAINENSAAILVAHHSNYKIIGFTSEPAMAELAELAHAHQLLLLYDQGSGALRDTAAYGLEPEPTVTAGVEAGCDIVSFSGDKLLGGPQSGMLVGRADLIADIKRHPLARAVRPDKLCLAGLSATLTHFLAQEEMTEIPVWRMISRPAADIAAEAQQWQTYLQAHGITAAIQAGESTVGGGSLPGTTLPTTVVALEVDDLDHLSTQLRQAEIPIIVRLQDGRLLLDPRTVLPTQKEQLLQTIVQLMRS